MGCGASTRPLTVSSWYASEGWVKSNNEDNDTEITPTKSNDGKINVTESAIQKVETGEESRFKEPENRNIGDGMLGVADRRKILMVIHALKPNQLFKDDQFPADKNALFYSDRDDYDITWKSPKDIISEPKLLVDGISRDDIRQVIPEPQPLFGKGYKGIVHFCFWRFGQWCDVFVDDALPVKNGSLIYGHNSDTTEFWVALLEKAYAKLHGSYEAIEGGQAMDALVDLTGGLAERYELKEHTQELYQKLARAAASPGAFITCSRKGDWKNHSNTPDDYGLIAGHAYTVTAVKRIRRKHGFECLLRVRNPWGMGEEWKGAWCDRDDRWNLVDKETKTWLQYVKKEDGEFWMSYRDFVKHFQEVTVCTVGPDFDGDGQPDESEKLLMVHGSWEVGISAGGCRNDIQSFSCNPQFLLTVHEADDETDSLLTEEEPRFTCSVLIGLLQEHRRSQRHIGVKMLQIGFLIYEAENIDRRLPVKYFMYNHEKAKSGVYVNFREVCGRFELEPGHYVIIPTTYNKDEQGEFLLRIFCAKPVSLKVLPQFNPAEDNMDEDDSEYDQPLTPPLVASGQRGQYPFDPNGEPDDDPDNISMQESNDREPSR